MRKLMFIALMAIAVSARAQQIDLKVLDTIAARAKGSTEIGMDEASLKAAAAATEKGTSKPGTGPIAKTTEGMKGFYLRSYEFNKGEFKWDDLKAFTDQLKAPNWVRFLKNKEQNEQTEIWWHVTNGQTDGMLLISAEEAELTIINAIGTSNVGDLSGLKNLGLFLNGGFK